MHLEEAPVSTSEVFPENLLVPEPPRKVVVLVGVATAAAICASVVLRFVTRSPLWLDEALTVNIARAPLGEISHLLRDDGAPPLYYYLLHFWMAAFGEGAVSTRALAGVIGVVNLPIAWLTGYRVGARSWDAASTGDAEARKRGRATAWSVTLLLASSPFAVYYDTEARMYGLVLLLGTLGVLALTALLARPNAVRALGVAAVASALLYTHYWALYVCAVTALGALYCSVFGPQRKAARYVVAALALAGLSFLPWLSTFVFQYRHTGTPWATPADLTAVVFTFTQFAGGNSDYGRALALIFFFLALLAVFGAPFGRHHVLMDLRSRGGVRALVAAVVATVIVAVVAGKISGSTFADRYTSVIAFPALLVFGYGLSVVDKLVRYGILGVAVALGLAASVPNATILRTQAGQVAALLNARSSAGDVVAYCPDQLGPSVSRLTNHGLQQLTFPREAPPQIVDWVNYPKTIASASPARFAASLEKRAGSRPIFYVSAPGYLGYGSDCQEIAEDLGRSRARSPLVADRPSDTPFEIYEGMSLEEFTSR